jgi:excinuclease UvrABC nuclease subunit
MSPIEIQNIVKNLPSLPGVYRFYGAGDIPLYIGKAKVLKNRVSSYFLEHRLADNPRLQLMVSQIVRVDYTVVSTEKDALILEANLIHNLQPKFNILLKDDRNYLYVRITNPDQKALNKPIEKHRVGDKFGNLEELPSNQRSGVVYNSSSNRSQDVNELQKTIEYDQKDLNYNNELYEVNKNLNFIPFYTYQNQIPTITLTRRKYDKTSEYFGPYTKKYGIFNVLRILRTIFPYCEKKISDGKPCQYVQIKQCDGICCGLEDIDSYNTKIEQIKKVLQGDTESVKIWLKGKILEAIELNNFELAALWRDKLNILDEVVSDQKIILPHPQNIDLISLLTQKDNDGFRIGSVFVQNIREGKIINVNNFLLSGTSGLEEQDSFVIDEIEIDLDNESEGQDDDIFGMCQNFLVEYYAQQKGTKPEVLLNVWSV